MLFSGNIASCGGAGTARFSTVGKRKGDCGGGFFLFCFLRWFFDNGCHRSSVLENGFHVFVRLEMLLLHCHVVVTIGLYAMKSLAEAPSLLINDVDDVDAILRLIFKVFDL